MTCNKMKVQQVIMSVIEKYRDMTHLWKQDHKDYQNMEKRNAAYEILLEIYKQVDDEATVKLLRKKIHNMRTHYIKEAKKVLASKQTGGEEYVPSLWYYEAFKFLDVKKLNIGPACPVAKVTVDPESNSSSDEAENESVATTSSSHQKRKREDPLPEKQEGVLLEAIKLMSKDEEDWKVYGQSIGHQMKRLDDRQLTIAQKLISDVMFYAKLGKLAEHSCVVLDPTEHNIYMA